MPIKRGRRVPIGAVTPAPTIATPCPHCGQSMRIINGLWLRHLRETARISLREFGRQVGLSSSYISDIERNRRSCPAHIEDIYASLKEAS